VSPTSGNTNTSFYWYVDYYDQDGDVPGTKNVYVDGAAYGMSLYSGAAANGTYRYGPMNLGGGNHSYYFYFTDGKGGSATTTTYSGPLVSGVPGFVLTAPPAPSATSVGDTVSVTWVAYNVTPGSTVSLCYDEDTIWWNGNEHWIVVDYGPVSNGAGSYLWNTTAVTPGTYYMAGYMYDWLGNWTFSHMGAGQGITLQSTFAITAPPAPYVANIGDSVLIQWTAGGVVPGSTVSLCYDEDTIWWNGNEHWIVVITPVSNGTGSYSWNTTGVTPGTYYMAGYMYDWLGNWTFSHMGASQGITLLQPRAVGIADFSGDGKPDILWRNTLNGRNVIWVMNGTTLDHTVEIGGVNTWWQVAGIMDDPLTTGVIASAGSTKTVSTAGQLGKAGAALSLPQTARMVTEPGTAVTADTVAAVASPVNTPVGVVDEEPPPTVVFPGKTLRRLPKRTTASGDGLEDILALLQLKP
jgi:hypothetical protein